MAAREVLQSWKEISAYLGRDVRTCRRWEKHLGLPVHRLDGSPRARVLAYKDEVDAWLEQKLHEREGAGDPPRPSLRRWYALAGFTFVLAVGVLGWRSISNGRARLASGGPRPFLAVLPLVNGTGEPDLGYLCEAVPDRIIHDLQRSADHITVFSTEAVVEAVRGMGFEPGMPLTPGDLDAFASRTGAGWLLVPYLAKSGSRLRIDYELREAGTGKVLGTGHVPGEEHNIGELESRVADGVRRAFGLPALLGPDASQACSVEAMRFYETARAIERRYPRSVPPDDLTRMIDLYGQAAAVDPGCPLVQVGLGDAYQLRFVFDGRRPEDLELMEKCYLRAYEMAPGLADANVGLGWLHFLRRDNDRAYECFKRAMDIDAGSIHVLTGTGSFLASVGLLERSAEYFTRVIKAGGASAVLLMLRAWSYEQMGLYESALADFDKMIEIEPGDWQTHCYRARVLVLMKRLDAAAAEIAMAETLAPGERYIGAVRALAAAARGQREAALAAIEPIRAAARPGCYTYFVSRVYASLGMSNEALADMRLAIDEGFDEVLDYFYFFPFLNNTGDYFYEKLRGDRRFVEILRAEERRYVDRIERYGGL